MHHPTLDTDVITVNFDGIANDTTLPEYVRRTSAIIQNASYVSLHHFFANLSDAELDNLNEQVDIIAQAEHTQSAYSDRVNTAYDILLKLTVLLAIAEGTELVTEEAIPTLLNTMAAFVPLHVLKRAGLVEVNPENLAFFDDDGLHLARLRQPHL